MLSQDERRVLKRFRFTLRRIFPHNAVVWARIVYAALFIALLTAT